MLLLQKFEFPKGRSGKKTTLVALKSRPINKDFFVASFEERKALTKRRGWGKQPSNRRDPWLRRGQIQEWRRRRAEPSRMGFGRNRWWGSRTQFRYLKHLLVLFYRLKTGSPAPEPATPTVAAPAPMNLAAVSISRAWAETAKGLELNRKIWIIKWISYRTATRVAARGATRATREIMALNDEDV